jgi:LTXXQ motif family protein
VRIQSALLIGFLATSGAVMAQHQHQAGYAGMENRDIKGLSPEQVADLRDGKGMGASLPAELNGIPGPLHVLQLKDQLKVTPEQQAALTQVTAQMKASAEALGARVISAERDLDLAFRSGTADEKNIEAATHRIAVLNGQLRAVHLVAHLQTRKLLSAQQVVAYNEVRGYGSETPNPGGGKH